MHIGTEFSETAAAAGSGATATHAAAAGSNGSPDRTHIVTALSGWADADSVLQILGGSNGTTIIFESKLAIRFTLRASMWLEVPEQLCPVSL